MSNLVSPKNRPFKATPKIREHFIKHPGIVVWIHELREIAEATGEKLSDKQLQGIVNTAKWTGMELQTVMRGQCWMYRPGVGNTVNMPPLQVAQRRANVEGTGTTRNDFSNIPEQPGPVSVINTIAAQMSRKERLYVEKMVTKSGDRILEDEDGILFQAKELDL